MISLNILIGTSCVEFIGLQVQPSIHFSNVQQFTSKNDFTFLYNSPFMTNCSTVSTPPLGKNILNSEKMMQPKKQMLLLCYKFRKETEKVSKHVTKSSREVPQMVQNSSPIVSNTFQNNFPKVPKSLKNKHPKNAKQHDKK